jgi:hypothetical protein
MKDRKNARSGYLSAAFFGLALIFLAVSTASAQDPTSPAEKQVAGTTAKGKAMADQIDRAAAKAKSQPLYRGYKNVEIGMAQEKVREILGKPRDDGDDQDLFVFDDDEMTQVFYDAKATVRAISTAYMKDLDDAPTPLMVIGDEVVPDENGSIYKMVRYPEAGYWVSYDRTGGENRIVTVTMQKI